MHSTAATDSAPQPTKAALSIDEATLQTPFSRSFLYAEMAAGRLASRKAGRRRVILRADLDAWLAALPVG